MILQIAIRDQDGFTRKGSNTETSSNYTKQWPIVGWVQPKLPGIFVCILSQLTILWCIFEYLPICVVIRQHPRPAQQEVHNDHPPSWASHQFLTYDHEASPPPPECRKGKAGDNWFDGINNEWGKSLLLSLSLLLLLLLLSRKIIMTIMICHENKKYYLLWKVIVTVAIRRRNNNHRYHYQKD